METVTKQISSDDRNALGQMQQKASSLHQSSSNNFLVALEGLMLSAIAWESIGKKDIKWISHVSKITTAIGLAITGIFTAHALTDHAKAAKVDRKLAQYGADELVLPSEMAAAIAPPATTQQPQPMVQADGREITRLQPVEQQITV